MADKAFKVVSMEEHRGKSEQEKREESREYHAKEFTECLTTIYSSLKKTGADYMTLPFLFLHLSMMLCDGYFVDLQEIKTNRNGKNAPAAHYRQPEQ